MPAKKKVCAVRVKMRDVAQKAGLSMAATSYALRGSSEVSPETIQRVKKIAKELGYSPSPVLGALAEYRRTEKRQKAGFETLAVLHHYAEGDFPGGPNRVVLMEHLNQNARERGYRVEVFPAGRDAASHRRTSDILYHRGIRGVFLFPFNPHWDDSTEITLNWKHFVCISLLNEQPSRIHHAVLPSWVRNREIILRLLERHEHRKAGVYVTRDVNLWSNQLAQCFYLHQNQVEGKPLNSITPFVSPDYKPERFLHWFFQTKPEIVITNIQWVPTWLRENGIKVPRDVGVIAFDNVQNKDRSGIDILPKNIARTAIRLMDDILRSEHYGIEECPFRLTVPGVWNPGKTFAF